MIATAIASIPSGAYALGAGPINVFSALGQPLRAEVPLTATPQELQTLSARIAPPEAFRQANVPYSAAVAALRVSVDTSGSRPVVRITSDRPLSDPFVDLLLEFNSSSGRLVREYTFLLDPVDVLAPRPVAATVATPRAPASAPAAPAATAPRAPAVAPGGSYRVQSGDTLNRIAENNRPAAASLDQMLVALLRENPEAFEGGNINRMRAGAILRIPTAEQTQALSRAEARREVVAQAADFEAYRQRLASGVPAPRAAETPAPISQEAAGRITPRVEETRPAAPATDRVEVSRAPAADAVGDAAQVERLRALEEDLIARDRALAEANARLGELERSIRDLQRLIELKSEQMAQLQQGVPPTAPAEPASPLAALDTPVDTPPPAAVEAPPPPAPPVEEPPAAVEEPPVEPAAVETPVAEPAAAPEPAARPQPQRRPPPPPPPPPPSFAEEFFGNPLTLAGMGGALALLLGYGAYRWRQRRKDGEQTEQPSLLMTEAPTGPNSVFGSTGGQSVDTSNSSVLHTDFSQSGLSAIDADEGVDPVAEADVYMAYGRDAQAEEILVDALKADPSRLAVYLKLLEVYAARKSVQQFETTAAELYSRTQGEGAEWSKAAAMGRELDPANPLYTGTAGDTSGPTTEPGSGAAVAPAAAAAAVAAGMAAMAAEQSTAEQPAAAAGENADFAEDSLGVLDFDLPDVAVADVAAEVPELPAEPAQADAAELPAEAAAAAQLKDTWAMPGGLAPFQDEGGEAAAEAASDAAAVDTNVLDFDLGFDSEELAADAAEGGEPVEQAAAVDDGAVLDFDIDAPTPGLGVTDTTAASVASTIVGTGDDLARLEAAMDEAETPTPAEAAADMSATVVQSEFGSGEFDMSATMVESDGTFGGGQPASEDVIDLEQTSFDNSLLDFDFEIDAPAPSAPEAPALDLSSIDLNLEAASGDEPVVPDAPAAPAGAAVEEVAAAPAEIDLPEPPVAGTAHVAPVSAPDFGAAEDEGGEEIGGQEVETKLELARAYDEMGDKEGARELLEEVLREGSADQQEAARQLLARLD